MEEIRKLEEQFVGKGEVKGFNFLCLKSNKWGFLYEVYTNDGKTHYEVFERKINKQYACESYPGSKSFGKWAWTYGDREKAMAKFETLEIRQA